MTPDHVGNKKYGDKKWSLVIEGAGFTSVKQVGNTMVWPVANFLKDYHACVSSESPTEWEL